MALGGLAPLPLRLGGSATDGLTSAQHARMVADVVALRRVSSLAELVYDTTGGVVTVISYRGANGSGPGLAPTPTFNGTGDVTWAWPAEFTDAAGKTRQTVVRMATASPMTDLSVRCSAVAQPLTHRSVRVRMTNVGGAYDGVTRLSVWDAPVVAIGDYDGAPDKEDSATEGERPYAADWYDELTAALGSAYTQARRGIVHARKIALARAMAVLSRSAEKLSANALPSTADELLPRWVEALRLRVRSGAPKWQVRKQGAAHIKAQRGTDRASVDAAVAELLGDVLVGLHRVADPTLSAPPTMTRWPGGVPGADTWSMTGAGGAWLSERSHLVVEVQRVPHLSEPEWLRLINVELSELLDTMLPAWSTFSWALAPLSDGFLLDISDLDFTGLTP